MNHWAGATCSMPTAIYLLKLPFDVPHPDSGGANISRCGMAHTASFRKAAAKLPNVAYTAANTSSIFSAKSDKVPIGTPYVLRLAPAPAPISLGNGRISFSGQDTQGQMLLLTRRVHPVAGKLDGLPSVPGEVPIYYSMFVVLGRT